MPEDEQRTLLTFAMDKFENDDLNGRQIRNTVRVALALAKLDDSNVRPKDLEDVVKIGREYARYIRDLNKGTPEDIANLLGRRGLPPPPSWTEDERQPNGISCGEDGK